MQNLENEIREYLEQRGWNNLKPGDLSKSISIEASELLEIFQWSNPTLDEIKENEVLVSRMKKELADVLIYCLDLSVLMGFDTECIIREKLEGIKKKYPIEIFSPNSSQEPGTEKEYWEIKNEYRKEER